jgi:hypothetical protein
MTFLEAVERARKHRMAIRRLSWPVVRRFWWLCGKNLVDSMSMTPVAFEQRCRAEPEREPGELIASAVAIPTTAEISSNDWTLEPLVDYPRARAPLSLAS